MTTQTAEKYGVEEKMYIPCVKCYRAFRAKKMARRGVYWLLSLYQKKLVKKRFVTGNM